MVEKRTWKEFKEIGMLWWINMILHTFGWAICVDVLEGEVTDAYPARVQYRGFDNQCNTEGYIKVSEYLEDNIEALRQESES